MGLRGPKSKYPPIEAGQKFGRLTAVSFENHDRHGNVRWNFRCDCGESTVQYVSVARRSKISSCGCRRRELAISNGKQSTTHGMHRTTTYRSWECMCRRCRSPKDKSYKNYGGRGITVSARWDSFENFFADMGERPQGTSLDRINNNGNYEPGNCRWATTQEQAKNKRPMSYYPSNRKSRPR
jgi:hypothetical protein